MVFTAVLTEDGEGELTEDGAGMEVLTEDVEGELTEDGEGGEEPGDFLATKSGFSKADCDPPKRDLVN
ncbi:Methionine aminopeptidase 2-2 [Dissostichus eleginoides]|uniref:Methionine aminopeptidase 2-2 n=1 Tax=Dissostichus eleginoides TaxID=100907 RepID=A0AAD9CHC5_DISEL|nr:Methionine aminopeptidase 2-2 [Dissostichus eleginoides]